MHLELLVEEPSAEAALAKILPKIINDRHTFTIHTFQGKQDLLAKLPNRLKGYKPWMSADMRIVVLVDRDREDCHSLKDQIEMIAIDAGLVTKSRPHRSRSFQIVNRLAIEELEAWLFGDVEAMKAAYPRIPPTLAERERYRDPDAIIGGTWEALEKVLKDAGYYKAGMPKIEVARNISQHMNPDRNSSNSFRMFREGIMACIS